jgi:superfamily II DNA or RNA helicase
MLADLKVKTAYRKGRDDIAGDFYLPAMNAANEYDRAVGFFRSAVFVIAWPALRGFVERGGRMRLLCSQVLAAGDVEALAEGYAARVDAEIAQRLRAEIAALLAEESLAEPARILAALVAAGVIEFKVAVLQPASGGTEHRIFHDKVGLFRDGTGSVLVFKGSANETWSGLAADGNLESVDVAASWLGGRDLERTLDETAYFEDLWADRYPGVDVRPFPETARETLVAAADPDWQGTLERITAALEPELASEPVDPKGRKIKRHQEQGLASWAANGRRGILKFATGSGKTFTALLAIREALGRGEVAVVVVPDTTLFVQWLGEITNSLADLAPKVLRIGAGNELWHDVLARWTAPANDGRIVLATVQTARTDAFRNRLTRGSHLLFVADEVHRLGSRANAALLDERLFGPRLGLSATPERAGDPEGTAAILEYFGGILDPVYGLSDAIRDKMLTPYFYRPHTVMLSEEEAAAYRSLSSKIAKARGRMGDAPGDEVRTALERLLFERARIVKQAAGKVPLTVEVVLAEYVRGQRWIVYCDDVEQLTDVTAALASAGVTAMPYHSAMDGNRAETLRWLDKLGGVVVAIKCLDEGVDIPSVTHALILASSRNPREFIQRRGRVLRTAPGKVLAHVHDAIVMPPANEHAVGDEDAEARRDPITAGELARAIEFAAGADNPAATGDLRRIAIDAGIDWETLTGAGSEDDDD